MAVYYYKARNKSGENIEGTVDAANQEAAASILLSRKLAILDISQKPRNYYVYLLNSFLLNHVSGKDMVVFFRQLAVMLDSNMPLVRALRILVHQTKNEYFRNVIAGVADEVEGGSKLSSAMEFYPDVFSRFYVKIILSGETSGRLSEVMSYLADQREKDYDLTAKIRGAMIYPAFIVAVLLVVAFIVVVFVIPNITAILIAAGAPLPLITIILIDTSNIFRDFWWLILILVAVAVIFWLYWIRTSKGRAMVDKLKLQVPIFGKIYQDVYVVRICLSFATLIKGGVPIAAALEVVKEVVDNVVYEQILVEAARNVDEGNPISEGLSGTFIPLVVTQMISVGEESGRLEEILSKIADFYSREIDNTVRNLSNIIEPVIMIILGVAVSLFVAAVILPMWQLSSAI